MIQTTHDITEVETVPGETEASGAAIGTNRTTPTSPVPPTHPDPEREREIDALLERAWPRIKASMYYLRDR